MALYLTVLAGPSATEARPVVASTNARVIGAALQAMLAEAERATDPPKNPDDALTKGERRAA